MMLIEILYATWSIAPIATALLVLTAAFGIGIGLGKLMMIRIERRAHR